MEYILGIVVPLIAFFYESYPRFLVKEYGVDIWTHLLYLKEYHRQKGIPKKIQNGFLVPGSYDYPPAFIFILSKFPIKLVEKYEFIFSPFFDMIHLFLIFLIVLVLFHSLPLALLTQVLYLFTPIIVIENSSATPRSLGYTFFSLEFLFLFLFNSQGNVLYLVSAILIGALIFLTHRFTTQGFLFFSVFFSFVTKNVSYVAVFFCSAFIAIVVSKGFYVNVLQGHLGNLSFWRKNIIYRFAHQIKGNIPAKKNKDVVFAIYNQFLKFPPFVLTITNPWTLPVLFALFFQPLSGFLLHSFLQLVIFSYVLALLTMWIPQLRFLGEGQRYLELSAFPTALIAAYTLLTASHAFFIPGVFVYGIFIIGSFITVIVIQRKAIIKDTLRRVTPSMQAMFNYLKTLKTKPKLLCIPHQITTNTIYHTGCPVFVNADYKNIQKIADVYPFMRKSISEIMKLHNLDLVLLNTNYATLNELKVRNPKIVKKFDNFVLFKPNK